MNFQNMNPIKDIYKQLWQIPHLMVKYCLPLEISNRQQCLLFNSNFNYSCDTINKMKDVRIGKKY